MSEFNPETAKAIALAISDPGATTPRMPGENVTSWSTRAVHPILARLEAKAEQRGAERVAAWVEAAVEALPTSRFERRDGKHWVIISADEIRAALKDGAP